MSAPKPRVSIITPSLNMASFLSATIESVLGQIYPEIEYIVVDGGSSDGSIDILREVKALLAKNKAHAINVDATILAEAPKIAPYIPAMRKAIARAIGSDESRIGIKATTNEGLGAIGRKEGIAAMAIATVEME